MAAHEPQRSMFATMDWLRKWVEMSQSVAGKSARASPQVDGSGVAVVEEMSLGMEERGKNQIRRPAVRYSRA